ncbi:MAG: hypothetical protein AAGC53_18795 [Actinomycetota bacterium]
MTRTLGLHVGPETIAAALAEGEPAHAREIALGASGPATAAAVAAGADGAVLVGDAARDADGPIVTDPLLRAGRGKTGALTAVITHVVGRAATVAGSSPNRLAIVVPDDFAAVERDNIVAAANAAGFTDVSLVPESLAIARGQGGDGTQFAIGAALVGSFDAPPPLVTAEDLGKIERPDTPPPTPPAAHRPVSVFDEPAEPELPPVRDAPTSAASAPPAQPPVQRSRPAAPAPAPAAMVSPPPLQPIPERTVPIGALAVGALVVIVAIVVALQALGGESDDAATVPATTTTQAVATTTSAAPTTTAVETTTTSTAPSSTTSTITTSSTSSTTTTTTTTTPVRVSAPGPITLGEAGLQFDTGALVRFGQGETFVLEQIESVLGEAEDDTGPIQSDDFCAGPIARFVRYGDLELVFTSPGDDPDAPLVFSQWYADGHLEPTGLVTPEGLGESATVGFLEVTFPNAFVLVPPFEGDIVGLFAITNPQTGGVINGTTLGLDPEGVVTTLWAGESCTRVFT